MTRFFVVLATAALMIPAASLMAGDSPQELRHELMEDVGGGAKTIGGMLKGEKPFDAAAAAAAFQVWADAAETFGDLFPEGSESGFGTEAAPAIWTDRAGFDAKLAEFAEASKAAVAAAPQDLDALKAAAGPAFETCKGCHEDYRIED
ncbi:MAG: cytochrome c [Xanthomonadales bacterium]|nr:cytochrome c [Xanthomonadales bacterium]